MSLTEQHRKLLVEIARASIDYGLERGNPLPINPANYPEELRVHRASFVTLKKQGDLRGCIGGLLAVQPLVNDVSQHAYAAAFNDSRFEPLQQKELAELSIDVSILTVPEPLHFTSEADLLQQLRPKIDGLILEESWHRGTFLPSVWETLPDPQDFLRRLKQKAGLPLDYWSPTIKIQRYTTE